MTFTLAIVGRPNVGKSTLFNRLAGKQLALVDDTPGVTRDWREAMGHIADIPVRLLDTAGLEEAFDDSLPARMRRQTEYALEQADAVLFVVDGRNGITPMDKHFADWLRRQKKPVVLAVNKCENDRAAQNGIAEAYGLGLGDPVAVSAAHNIGIDEIYHLLKEYLPVAEAPIESDSEYDAMPREDALDDLEGRLDYELKAPDPEEETKPIKIAIAGRPNVGKSTLMNAILGEERVLTGPEAGITRDSIAVDWEYDGRAFKLVDTAGLRRKARVTGKLERMSTDDTLRAIRLAQVVILVLDANAALEKQDLTIAQHIIDEGRSIIIALNKWDAVEDKNARLADFKYALEHSLAQVRDIPFVALSALHGRNVEGLLKATMKAYEVWNRRVPTGRLNRWLAARESQNPAPLANGRNNRLKYIAQIKTRPPTFALWASQPKEIPDAYKRYLINGLREDFDLPGTPVRLTVRASRNPYAD